MYRFQTTVHENHIYMYMHTRKHIHVHVYKLTNYSTYVQTHLKIHNCICTLYIATCNIQMYTYNYMYIHVHSYKYTYVCMYINVYVVLLCTLTQYGNVQHA